MNQPTNNTNNSSKTTVELMTDKQRQYLERLLAQMKERAVRMTGIRTYKYDARGIEIFEAPTPETDMEAYAIRGFWERATVNPRLTKVGASKMIDLIRDGDPRYVLNYLLEHDKLTNFGQEAADFLMSLKAE